MYTGSSVFKGLTVGQVFFAVVYQAQRPAIPEDFPDALVTLMTSCWSADPLQRCVAFGTHCFYHACGWNAAWLMHVCKGIGTHVKGHSVACLLSSL